MCYGLHACITHIWSVSLNYVLISQHSFLLFERCWVSLPVQTLAQWLRTFIVLFSSPKKNIRITIFFLAISSSTFK